MTCVEMRSESEMIRNYRKFEQLRMQRNSREQRRFRRKRNGKKREDPQNMRPSKNIFRIRRIPSRTGRTHRRLLAGRDVLGIMPTRSRKVDLLSASGSTSSGITVVISPADFSDEGSGAC